MDYEELRKIYDENPKDFDKKSNEVIEAYINQKNGRERRKRLRSYQKHLNFLSKFLDMRTWRRIYKCAEELDAIDDVLIIHRYICKKDKRGQVVARQLQKRLYYAFDYYDEFYWDYLYKKDAQKADVMRQAVIIKFVLLVSGNESHFGFQEMIEVARSKSRVAKGKHIIVQEMFYNLIYGRGASLERLSQELEKLRKSNLSMKEVISPKQANKKVIRLIK